VNGALLIGIALGALAVVYVLWPLLKPTPAARRSGHSTPAGGALP
jgi:hypothetical protein